MKKSILNIGKALSKTEQKSINGGYRLGNCPIGTHSCPGLCGGAPYCSDYDGDCVC